jgi:septal ring factor EnvC (AmiA/AmiB activator)
MMGHEQLSSQEASGSHRYPHGVRLLVSRVVMFCLLGLVLAFWASCGALEPMDEPELTDLQLTVDTLKASVRDAQRTATELRNELEASRQSLAETQVARAQLEGRVREAERRLAESKRVIDLQREELASARTERERLSRSSVLMQSQLKQLHKQMSRLGKAGEEGQPSGLSPANGPPRKTQKATIVSAQTNSPLRSMPERNVSATPASLVRVPQMRDSSHDRERSEQRTRYVTVKTGDTLWSIAHRYRVDVYRLRTTNQLVENLIEVGQTLRLPESRIEAERAIPVP